MRGNRFMEGVKCTNSARILEFGRVGQARQYPPNPCRALNAMVSHTIPACSSPLPCHAPPHLHMASAFCFQLPAKAWARGAASGGPQPGSACPSGRPDARASPRRTNAICESGSGHTGGSCNENAIGEGVDGNHTAEQACELKRVVPCCTLGAIPRMAKRSWPRAPRV